MPRKTAGRIVARKSPSKDANGGKLGQFTTEVKETYNNGLKRGIEIGTNFISIPTLVIGFVIGAALMALFKQV